MKILSCLSIFIAIVSLSAVNGQPKFGIRGGLKISNLSGDDVGGGVDSKPGVILGGIMQYQFAEMFELQPELLFSMKGAQSESKSGINTDVSLNYIEVPVLVKLIIPIKGNTTLFPSLLAGPILGLNISAQSEQTTNNQSQTTDVSDEIKTFDFGFGFGGSILFPLGNNKLGFDLRYNFGITSIDDTGYDYDVKNTTVSLTGIFVFH